MSRKCANPMVCGSDGETCAKPGCDFFDEARVLRELTRPVTRIHPCLCEGEHICQDGNVQMQGRAEDSHAHDGETT